MTDHKAQPDLTESPAFLQLLNSQHILSDQLEEIRSALRTGPVDVAVASIAARYTEVPDWIIGGNERIVLGTPGFGASIALPVAAGAQRVLPENVSRLGGRIVNSGAGALTLFLCSLENQQAGSAGVPQIWLPANGGAWDLKLANVVWCGFVIAVAAVDTSLTVAEV